MKKNKITVYVVAYEFEGGLGFNEAVLEFGPAGGLE